MNQNTKRSNVKEKRAMLGGIAPPQSTIDGDVDRVLQERTVVLICSFSTKREEWRFSIETLQREREKKKRKNAAKKKNSYCQCP